MWAYNYLWLTKIRARLITLWNSCCSLIDLPSILCDPLSLSLLCRLVVITESYGFISPIKWEECSWIPNICNIAHLSNNQDYNGTGPRFINHMSLLHVCLIIFLLCPSKPCSECFLWVPWEATLSNDKLVKVISQIICTCCSTMTIIDSKEWTPRPVFMLSRLRFQYIQNDWNSILIIIPHYPLVSIGSICLNYSVFLDWTFRWLMIRYYDSGCRLESNLLLTTLLVEIDHFPGSIFSTERLELGGLWTEEMFGHLWCNCWLGNNWSNNLRIIRNVNAELFLLREGFIMTLT